MALHQYGVSTMARPDPRMVPRLPMARRQTHVTWTRGGDREEKVLQLFCGKSLNLDAFHQLIERSEAITEGRIETTDPAIASDRQ